MAHRLAGHRVRQFDVPAPEIRGSPRQRRPVEIGVALAAAPAQPFEPLAIRDTLLVACVETEAVLREG
jgi:hypothetical protein